MAYEYSDLVTGFEHWLNQSVSEGWIDKEQANNLQVEQENSAHVLFTETVDRPLVVAFLGGTGVGKSSLLNKLAGQSIARTGVERPTSREVTLFYHQSVSLQQLEDKFPLQQIQLSQHSEAANKKIIWIDMPDFDSTEEKNKNIVMQWLPYIDVLIYVVSPERYRDNKAWQLLLSEGEKHAWLFAMNQWDKGDATQYEDFKKQLSKAGFDNPLIFKTSCADDFELNPEGLDQLQSTIQSLATQKTVEHIESRGEEIRKNHLKAQLQSGLQALGDESHFDKLLVEQQRGWAQTKKVLKQGLQWPVKQAAMAYSTAELSLQQDKIMLWDDWAESRFNDYIDELILTANQLQLPVNPFRQALTTLRTQAETNIHTQAELGCRQALVNPGHIIQRIFLKFVRVCELVLPLIAMTVVSFEVLEQYYDGAFANEAYLGVNFVVHSLLLILMSWLFPFFILKKMQPSLEKAALQGIEKGIDIAMNMLDIESQQSIKALRKKHTEKTKALKELIKACEQTPATKNETDHTELNRLLIHD